MKDILEKINKAALKFLTPLTPQETYAIIVKEAIKLGNVEYGTIHLEQEGRLERVYASLPILYQIIPRKDGNTYKAFNERRIIIDDNIDRLTKIHPQLKQLGIRQSIFIPLSYRNKSIGVFVISTRKKENFNTKEFDALKLFGSMATLAIRKAQLYSETIKALETRDLFIAMAAHELRTPITTIHGYTQLLQRRLSGKNVSESRWIKELSWETQRLILLVNELLEVNRIKEGQLRYVWKECSIKTILQRSIANLSFTHPDRKILLQDRINSSPDIVIGDSDKLIQVFNNILENAAKFSPSSTNIIVSLRVTARHFVVTVKDKGKGIDEQHLSKVFDGFYRKAKDTEQGMGLGLFLAKNIVKIHHGSTNIRSKLNKGTIVEVKLPKRTYGV